MTYILKHPTWFSNRPSFSKNSFGISPSSKFLYTDEELKRMKDSCSLISQALIRISNDITNKGAYLVAKKNSDASYTNGEKIVIGMNPIRIAKELSVGMDIEIGLSCHESCHCAYTDFNNYDFKNCTMPIAHWLHNVYEDECIEEMLGLVHPQWMYFLDNVLNHYFNEESFIREVKKISNTSSKIDIAQFMILYMVRMSRLSNRFSKDWINEFGPMLDEIYEKVIINIENPKKFKYSPTKETIQATKDTLEILKKYVSLDEMNSKLKFPMSGMIGNSTSEGDPNNCKSDDRRCGSNGLYSPNTKSGRSKSTDSVDNRYDKAKEENNQDAEQIKNSRNQIGSRAVKEIAAEKPSQGDIATYNRIKNTLKDEINVAKKIIISSSDKKVELCNDDFNRNGQLINSQLVQAIQGVNCVYRRKTTKLTKEDNPRYAFVIAVDESGSMDFTLKDGSNPKEIATRLAIVLYEAMKDYPGIDTFIYGHSEYLTKYASPKDKKPERLATRKSHIGQNEVLAYDTIIKDVRMQTNKPIFMINITDCGYLCNPEAIKDKIEELKKNNVSIELISVFNDYVDSTVHDKINDYIYGSGNYVKVNNSNMKSELIKLVKSLARKYKSMK